MTKEELKAYLKENLFIEINTITEVSFGEESVQIEVTIGLEDEIISEAHITLPS